MVAAIAALGGLLFGYDTGVISGAILYIKRDFLVSEMREGLVVAAVTAGALLGALLAGRFTDSIGRRATNLVAGLLFVLASAVTYTHNIGIALLADLEKLLGLDETYFLVSASNRAGNSLTAEHIGNVYPVQQIYGGETTRLVNPGAAALQFGFPF